MIKKSLDKSEVKSIILCDEQTIINLENGCIISVRAIAKKVGYASYESKTEYMVIPNKPAKEFNSTQLDEFLADPLVFATG